MDATMDDSSCTDNNTEQANDTSLSTQTTELRKVLKDCSNGIERLRKAQDDGIVSSFANDGAVHPLIHRAVAAADAHRELRQNGINDLRRRLVISSEERSFPIDVLHMSSSNAFLLDGGDVTIQTHEFKQRYCARNVPCIIRGLDMTNFAHVSSQWRSEDNAINVDWFRNCLGGDTKVPVRVDATNDQNGNQDDGLDADGRATECETVEMKLCEWIEYCKQTNQSTLVYPCEYKGLTSIGYLKDWHLLQFLKSKQQQQQRYNSQPQSINDLYSVPSIFERDLLNNFLTKYTGGDYKFVYWGPAQSRTNLHSDVLHSFSWSYNVVGKKRWTLYVPSIKNGRESQCLETFELIQETGDTIFVPAMWKHEVVNLVETLSINHNWITAANIDCTYQCLLTEISSIEKEIRDWGVLSNDDCETRENMLRGCVGLDVTMLVMMALCELIDLLNEFLRVEETSRSETADINNGYLMDRLYSTFSLYNLLNSIVLNEAEDANTMKRLAATLQSEEMANDVKSYSEFCIGICRTLAMHANIKE